MTLPDDTLVQSVWRRLPRTFEALSDRNFRWFFLGLFGGFASMNMQMFVRGWLVFEITGSYEKLGFMTAAGGVVGLFAAPLGGVVADRLKQKKTIIQYAQSFNALLALAIGYLIAIGELRFEHLLAVSILQGVSMNVMMPARQALTTDIIGLEKLTNAVALNTSSMNVSRLLLPGLAGGMVAALGGGDGNIEPAQWVYYVMVGLYVFAVGSLMRVSVADRVPSKGPQSSMLEELRSGFSYVVKTPVIFMLLGFNFVMVFFSMSYFTLLPGFTKDVLQVGPEKLGLLMSISGIGSLVGSLMIASMSNRRRAKVILFGTMVSAIGLILFSITTYYWLSVLLLTIVGFGSSARMSLSNVLIQTYVDDNFRGRVMSIYMLEMSVLSILMYPVSVIADVVGPQWVVGVTAAMLVVLLLFLYSFRPYRDID